jgi:probable HAF family extracellular repeat protein
MEAMFGGFLYNLPNQTFEAISYPGGDFTYPTAINNSGTVAGWFMSGGGYFGFALVGSHYRQILPPGAVQTTVDGISATGKLVGYFTENFELVNFSFYRGQYKKLPIHAHVAIVVGIDSTGSALVGSYSPSPGITAGFIYQNGRLTELQFPGSSATTAVGINSAGEVVGNFVDASSTYHGFLWTPAAHAAKK